MADRLQKKRIRRERRKHQIRNGIFGTAEKPRLSVFKSSRHIYAQLIDDASGRTLASASTVAEGVRENLKYSGNRAAAQAVGAALAEKAATVGIKQAVFDRNGFRFHGRLQALADAAREKGLTV